jgi:hypothetical protein
MYLGYWNDGRSGAEAGDVRSIAGATTLVSLLVRGTADHHLIGSCADGQCSDKKAYS